jgi:hypothetical protein
MAHFPDLSDYAYWAAPSSSVREKNVGWLAACVPFAQAPANKELLGLLWSFCKLSVNQTRGFHLCEFCSAGSPTAAEHEGESLLLGSAEIRVFARSGDVFAAPNLIFHYVAAHSYRPPECFLAALREGPRAGSAEYLELLAKAGLSAQEALVPAQSPAARFRFIRTPEGVKKVPE